MINAYDTEDGVVFDMSGLECEALRSYADGLLAGRRSHDHDRRRSGMRVRHLG